MNFMERVQGDGPRDGRDLDGCEVSLWVAVDDDVVVFLGYGGVVEEFDAKGVGGLVVGYLQGGISPKFGEYLWKGERGVCGEADGDWICKLA